MPNCLDVFGECVAVPFDGRTEAQYKSAVSRIAQRPCRVVLRLVEVSAEYDTAQFELLTDDGGSGLALLERAGNLGNYNRNLRARFAINNVKAKGLDAEKRSIGDRVVLVGLGYVVAASPWGAGGATGRCRRRSGEPEREPQALLRSSGRTGPPGRSEGCSPPGQPHAVPRLGGVQFASG